SSVLDGPQRAGWERETMTSFARPRRAREATEVSFFWLNYRDRSGFAAAAVIESSALILAGVQATVFGLDDGLKFVSGHKIDAAGAEQIRARMIDRLLDEDDLRRHALEAAQHAARRYDR